MSDFQAHILSFNEFLKENVFDLDKLYDYNRELHKTVISNPLEILPYAPLEKIQTCVGILPEKTPKSLGQTDLYKLVSVNGVVIESSVPASKLTTSVHSSLDLFYCKDYMDSTMLGISTSLSFPKSDMDKNALFFHPGLSEYTMFQRITIQENIESAVQVPVSLLVVLHGSLCERVCVGDKVHIYGIFKLLNQEHKGVNKFKPFISCINICLEKKDLETADTQDLPVHSAESLCALFCPNICGLTSIKMSILLMIVGGGSQKDFKRSSINILLCGNPGTAKSQLLKYVSNLTKSICTSGRGTTGVGLTASVLIRNNEKILTAGALVLSDLKVCCIDEFDKMHHGDRIGLHEVMEQQTVSISKAGIVVTLNARCSILAACNPFYGYYDASKSLQDNVCIENSILTRFDFPWVVPEDDDLKIGDYVLSPSFIETSNDGIILAHIERARQIDPIIGNEAKVAIREYYIHARKKARVTPRFIESVVRACIAYSRLRLSSEVTLKDVGNVIKLFNECYGMESIETIKRQLVEISGTDDANAVFYDQTIDLLFDLKENENLDTIKFSELMNRLNVSELILRDVLASMESNEIIYLKDDVIYLI